MQALLSGNPWQLSFWLPPPRLSPKAKNIKVSQEICLNFSFLFGSFTSWQHFNFFWPAFQNSGKEKTKKETTPNFVLPPDYFGILFFLYVASDSIYSFLHQPEQSLWDILLTQEPRKFWTRFLSDLANPLYQRASSKWLTSSNTIVISINSCYFLLQNFLKLLKTLLDLLMHMGFIVFIKPLF